MVITFSLYLQDLFWLCFECEPEIESKDTGDRGLKELRASMEGEALCGTIITRSIYLRCLRGSKTKGANISSLHPGKQTFSLVEI